MKDYELLEKQAAMMRMAEKYGVDDWRRLVKGRRGNMTNFTTLITFTFNNEVRDFDDHQFALGVVEGKPVFAGDYLYTDGTGFCADETINDSWLTKYAATWNPPKPKTVMVELLVEDAQRLSSPTWVTEEINRVANACRKALEGLK